MACSIWLRHNDSGHCAILRCYCLLTSYSHLENFPARGQPVVAVNPGLRNILGKLLQLVCCCLGFQLLEHWPDFTIGQERQGHEFMHILVCAIVMIVLVLESSSRNYLKKNPANY